jgi:hypothetical protein
MSRQESKLKAMEGVDRDHKCKSKTSETHYIPTPALLSPLARPGTFETDKLVCTLPCLARRGIVRGSLKLFCSCSHVAKRRASGKTGPFSTSLPLPFVRPFASGSLPFTVDAVGKGAVDLSEFQGAGTPVPYVSFSGPRWSTVGWERRVMRDSTAPCKKTIWVQVSRRSSQMVVRRKGKKKKSKKKKLKARRTHRKRLPC